MNNLIIRHDDFDFRLTPNEYIEIHEQFIKADLVETAVIQFTQDNRLSSISDELVNYMLNSSHWDFQLHGWAHTHYDELKYDYIVRDMSAAIFWCKRIFGKTPTIWFPPWNCMSREMELAAEVVGLRIDNESNDIAKFIRETEVEVGRNGVWQGRSVYFHGWKSDEMKLFPRMLELANQVKLNEN